MRNPYALFDIVFLIHDKPLALWAERSIRSHIIDAALSDRGQDRHPFTASDTMLCTQAYMMQQQHREAHFHSAKQDDSGSQSPGLGHPHPATADVIRLCYSSEEDAHAT